MNRHTAAVILAIFLGVGVIMGVYASTGVIVDSPVNPGDNLIGFHIYGTETNPRGISFDLDNSNTASRIWSMGLERTNNDFFLYSHSAAAYQMITRGDTGQVSFGTSISRPLGGFQMGVTGGTSTAPRSGIQVALWGNQDGVYIYQQQSVTKRVKINFNNVFQIGTDSSNASGTPDLWTYDIATGLFPLKISDVNNTDTVYINYGATVAGALKHTGTTLGFYNATPVAKPTITGCRSDGTALVNLLTALKNQGLINDSTTP
jgi:hypothetical protein